MHLRQPFVFWIRNRHRLQRVLVGTVLTVALVFAFVVAEKMPLSGLLPDRSSFLPFARVFMRSWFATWLRGVGEPVDLHLGISLGVIVLTACQSPARGLRHVFEASWLVLIAIVSTLACCVVADLVDFWLLYSIEGSLGDWSILAWGRSTRVFVWFEPCILAMGIVSFYQLIIIGSQRVRLHADRSLMLPNG